MCVFCWENVRNAMYISVRGFLETQHLGILCGSERSDSNIVKIFEMIAIVVQICFLQRSLYLDPAELYPWKVPGIRLSVIN